jgi:hypothetical protein
MLEKCGFEFSTDLESETLKVEEELGVREFGDDGQSNNCAKLPHTGQLGDLAYLAHAECSTLTTIVITNQLFAFRHLPID